MNEILKRKDFILLFFSQATTTTFSIENQSIFADFYNKFYKKKGFFFFCCWSNVSYNTLNKKRVVNPQF